MRVYRYLFLYVCIDVKVYTFRRKCVCVDVDICVDIDICIDVDICVDVYRCVCVCERERVCLDV